MYKLFFYLLISFSSLTSLSAIARDCGSGIGITWGITNSSQPMLTGSYTSANSGSLGELRAVTVSDMNCQSDYMDSTNGVSQMIMRLSDGLQCKNSDTISINGSVGLEWKLTGMSCLNGNQIRSDTVKTATGYGTIRWPTGTLLGVATLQITDEYWRSYPAEDQRNVIIRTPSFGVGSLIGSPNVNITSFINDSKTMNILNQGTCTLSLPTENLDFGRITPTDINSGNTSRDFTINFSCMNKAIIANGLTVRFDPEHVVNASQGTFSAIDNDGRNLIFKLSMPGSSINEMPLNRSWVLLNASANDPQNASQSFRIQVMPSSPLPTGRVSTYLNITLAFR
ncbi:fimbrial protein [Citrobacter amalonaticus]